MRSVKFYKQNMQEISDKVRTEVASMKSEISSPTDKKVDHDANDHIRINKKI